MTEREVIRMLRAAIDEAGSQRAFAKTYGFSPAYVNDVLHGRRPPAGQICAALGVARKVEYRRLVEYKRRGPGARRR